MGHRITIEQFNIHPMTGWMKAWQVFIRRKCHLCGFVPFNGIKFQLPMLMLMVVMCFASKKNYARAQIFAGCTKVTAHQNQIRWFFLDGNATACNERSNCRTYAISNSNGSLFRTKIDLLSIHSTKCSEMTMHTSVMKLSLIKKTRNRFRLNTIHRWFVLFGVH